MSKAQELFNDARKHYQHAVTTINHLAAAYQQHVDQGRTGYSPARALAQFDLILQTALLNQAIADGEFDALEKQFVTKLTSYGNLMDYIREATGGQLDIDWKDLARLDVGTLRKLIRLLPTMLSSLCDDFASPLSLVDRSLSDPGAALNSLIEDIACISKDMAYIDGVATDEEVHASVAMVSALIGSHWN